MKIIIFGCGRLGREYLTNLADETQVVGFTDNNQLLWNKYCMGLPVIPPGRLPEHAFDKIVISIGVPSAVADVVKQLSALGIDAGKISYSYDITLGASGENNTLSKHARKLDSEKEQLLTARLLEFFSHIADPAAKEKEIRTHLYERLDWPRVSVVPWLGSLCNLQSARILEIGCGTGASTVALLEQGASVYAVDVDRAALSVAQYRCALYGLQAEFALMNATDIAQIPGQFDMVIFSASLEHMTYEERIKSIQEAFKLVGSGLVVLYETPNRLWCIDAHTSFAPFFNWLPDNVAMDYARFTERAGFNTAFSAAPADATKLARWGRGVSYHEIEIALGQKNIVDVVSSMNEFLGWGRQGFSLQLEKVKPAYLHGGFCEPYLNLAMRLRDDA